MSISQQPPFIHFLTIVAIVMVFSYGHAAVVCPTPTSISPCSCGLDGNTTLIACPNKNLNDSKASSVLNAFLAPGLRLVTSIWMVSNQLTKIPKEVSKFPFLSSIDFSYNKIKTIPSGVFSFPKVKKIEIDLSGNQIASVPSDAFRFPSATSVKIILTNNKLSSIPSAAFSNFTTAIDSLIIYLDWNNIASIQRNALNFISDNTKTIYINLASNKIKTIPCGPFGNPLWSNQVVFDFNYNQITTIPSCAFVFPSAKSITLYFNYNSLTTISPGAFHFPSATLVILMMDHNKISSIPPNTFAHGKYYLFSVRYNQLKRFESSVFKSPLLSLHQFSFLEISANPIDCTTDPCHLAWILTGANSTQMRSRILGHGADGQQAGVCAEYSYQPPFTALNSFDFKKKCNCTFN